MTVRFFGITNRVITYSHTIGRIGNAGLGFICPWDIAAGSDGVLYVISRGIEDRPMSLRITMCTLDDEHVGYFGSIGNGNGEFLWPTGISIDSQGDVYLSDEWLNRISVYDKKGAFLCQWGVEGCRTW